MANTPAPKTSLSPLRVLVPIAAILALVVFGLTLIKYQYGKKPAEGGSPAEIQVGTIVPDFTLQRLDQSTTQASEIKAKVLMVNFWATWCEACIIEMPSIIKLRNEYTARGFEIISINLDEEPQAVVPKASKQLGIDFPVYVDPESKLSDLFDVHAIPLTVILDKNRSVLMIESGERDWFGNDIRTQLESWLSG